MLWGASPAGEASDGRGRLAAATGGFEKHEVGFQFTAWLANAADRMGAATRLAARSVLASCPRILEFLEGDGGFWKTPGQ